MILFQALFISIAHRYVWILTDNPSTILLYVISYLFNSMVLCVKIGLTDMNNKDNELFVPCDFLA